VPHPDRVLSRPPGPPLPGLALRAVTVVAALVVSALCLFRAVAGDDKDKKQQFAGGLMYRVIEASDEKPAKRKATAKVPLRVRVLIEKGKDIPKDLEAYVVNKPRKGKGPLAVLLAKPDRKSVSIAAKSPPNIAGTIVPPPPPRVFRQALAARGCPHGVTVTESNRASHCRIISKEPLHRYPVEGIRRPALMEPPAEEVAVCQGYSRERRNNSSRYRMGVTLI
jgi:hypothetical protein